MIKRFTRTIAICALLSIGIYAAICIAHIIDFPSEIRLTENTQHQLTFQAPLRATIASDTVDVLMVNHAPVEEGITVSLQNPVWIEASSSGTATMQLSAFGFPVREVTLDILPGLEVIPCGITVGVRINTNGVMVLGTGTVIDTDGQYHNPSGGKLRAGDLILNANGKDLTSKEDLMTAIAESGDTLLLQIMRDNETIETTITPVQSEKGNMIGSWVRDSTQGIGTITYFNPTTGNFGALGHGIMDVDTKKLMSVKSGRITAARITNVKKGARGTPGELVGEIQVGNVLGQIKTNSPFGIYGVMSQPLPSNIPLEPVRVAKQDQIEEGPAIIRTNVADSEVRDFAINVESVNRFSTDETKGMVIRITDPELLAITGGIVQGMSGSPILQNGKIIGAVTHVFVQDPTKGYGIFIENMIRHEQENWSTEADVASIGKQEL
ncbi:MAG: SpoIVB peptidase [Defluviitaleaceae bacterium]|nr:SpoIVB peptidase [Defluviitaleaceae bacterium]